MSIQLQPTFLYFLGNFPNLRCPSNSFIPNSLQLGDSTHPSKHPHFRHIQLFLLCFLHCPRLGTVHHCWSYNPLYTLPLTRKLILRLHVHTHNKSFYLYKYKVSHLLGPHTSNKYAHTHTLQIRTKSHARYKCPKLLATT